MSVLTDEQLIEIYNRRPEGWEVGLVHRLRAVAEAAIAADRAARAEAVSDVKADALRYKMAFEMATAGGREVYYEGWGGRMRRGYLGPEEARTATLEAVDKQLLAQKP